jgi:hypothetical protein
LFIRADYGTAPEHEALVWGMMPVAIIFAASCLSLVVVSLLTKPPSESTLRKFLPRVKA